MTEFKRQQWYVFKQGIIFKQKSQPRQHYPWEFIGEFWDLFREKQAECARKQDKAKWRKLEAIRSAAVDGMKGGEVPKWVENWLKYMDVGMLHWSENAEEEQWPTQAEDEYNGVEDEDLWWDGEDHCSFDRLGNCKDADGLLPSERIFGRGWR